MAADAEQGEVDDAGQAEPAADDDGAPVSPEAEAGEPYRWFGYVAVGITIVAFVLSMAVVGFGVYFALKLL